MGDPGARRRISLSPREELLFEAGIKLGGVFHQYIGVPVAPRTRRALARAIEDALRLQPFVEEARVRIDPARGGPVGRGRYAYRYLTAEMLDASVSLARDGHRITARLAYDPALRYPLMRVEELTASRAPASRPARRSARR